MTAYIRFENIASFAIGVINAVALYQIIGWWLNSGRGVGITVAVLFGLSFVVAYWRSHGRTERAISLWMGSLVGMAIVLFLAGPGTIWPLVLGIAAVMTAAPVLGGLVVASMLGWITQA